MFHKDRIILVHPPFQFENKVFRLGFKIVCRNCKYRGSVKVIWKHVQKDFFKLKFWRWNSIFPLNYLKISLYRKHTPHDLIQPLILVQRRKESKTLSGRDKVLCKNFDAFSSVLQLVLGPRSVICIYCFLVMLMSKIFFIIYIFQLV